MNIISGMLIMAIYTIALFIAAPLTMTLLLYRVFPPNFSHVKDEASPIQPAMSIQTEAPLSIAFKKTDIAD